MLLWRVVIWALKMYAYFSRLSFVCAKSCVHASPHFRSLARAPLRPRFRALSFRDKDTRKESRFWLNVVWARLERCFCEGCYKISFLPQKFSLCLGFSEDFFVIERKKFEKGEASRLVKPWRKKGGFKQTKVRQKSDKNQTTWTTYICSSNCLKDVLKLCG